MVGFLTGFGWADEGDLADEHIYCCRQDKPKVTVMDSSAGTLDQYRVHGEETIFVSDGHVVWFTWMPG